MLINCTQDQAISGFNEAAAESPRKWLFGGGRLGIGLCFNEAAAESPRKLAKVKSTTTAAVSLQ